MGNFSKKQVIIFDGLSYCYKAYHAFPLLKNRSEEPTGAIYGMLSMLRKVLLKYSPTHAAVVFDTKGKKTFRHKIFSEYKSNRSPMPENLRTQLQPLYKIITAMGLVIISIPDVEADDVIGTLAYSLQFSGYQVLIGTNDKDIAQLVSSNIFIINNSDGMLYKTHDIKHKYGVFPELIPDFIALVGDKSDNIPGVPGIGKKTATILLNEIGTLKNIYSNLESTAELNCRGARNLKKILLENREVACLSYKLANIKTNISLNVSYDELRIQPPTLNVLLSFFKQYEFNYWKSSVLKNNWLKKPKINSHRGDTYSEKVCSTSTKKYIIITCEKILYKWIKRLRAANFFAFNIECIKKNDKYIIEGFSFAIASGEAIYIPTFFNEQDTLKIISYDQVICLLRPILTNTRSKKVGINIKSILILLKKFKIALGGQLFDISLESYILNNTVSNSDIYYLSEYWLNKKSEYKNKYYQEAEKVDFIFQLHSFMWLELQKDKCQLSYFKNIEMPLIKTLTEVESYGVKVNNYILSDYLKKSSKRMKLLKKIAYRIVGIEFNLSSSQQLSCILFKKYGIKDFKKTPKGAPSTAESSLKMLSSRYRLPEIVLEYRGLVKLNSTYIKNLLRRINPQDQRVYATYNQSITSTGRLSCKHPNLQNIPVGNLSGYCIRRAFIAPDKHVLVGIDYSQIELRIMAHFSKDKILTKAFNLEQDIHAVTASEIFNIPITCVTKQQRGKVKSINFGLIYGIGAIGLSNQLNISSKESREYINRYFQRYPKILHYIENTKVKAKEKGYVKTILGRRIYIPNINSDNPTIRKSAERMAVNATIQGTAADIIKKAMITTSYWIKKNELKVHIIMQIHDELLLEVNRDNLSDIKNVASIMESAISLSVPIRVNLKYGVSWGEIKTFRV